MQKRKNFLLAAGTVLLTVGIAVLLICFCGGTGSVNNTHENVELWYADTDLLRSRIATAVSTYNAGKGSSDGVHVELKAFQSESELYEALDQAAENELPELVICGANYAAGFAAEDKLADIDSYFKSSDLNDFSADFLMASEFEEKLTSIPMWATVGVLIRNDELCSDAGFPDSFESLCETAKAYYASNGKMYFTMTDYAYFFRNAVLQLGGDFDALSPYDTDSDDFKYVYNLLAETAYDRGFAAADGNAATLVASGEAVCALVSTADIMAATQDADMTVCSLAEYPLLRGGESVYTLDVTGITLMRGTEDKELASVKFIKWLTEEDNIEELTANTGYIPPCGKMTCGGETGRSLVSIVSRYQKEYKNTLLCADAELAGRTAEFNGILSSIMRSLS